MSLEQFLSENRNLPLDHYTVVNYINDFMQGKQSYESKSSVYIHIGRPIHEYQGQVDLLYVCVLADYKLMAVMLIYYDGYKIVEETTRFSTLLVNYECNEDDVNRAIKLLINLNYDFELFRRSVRLIVWSDLTIHDDSLVIGSFMPRITKSSYSTTKSSRS